MQLKASHATHATQHSSIQFTHFTQLNESHAAYLRPQTSLLAYDEHHAMSIVQSFSSADTQVSCHKDIVWWCFIEDVLPLKAPALSCKALNVNWFRISGDFGLFGLQPSGLFSTFYHPALLFHTIPYQPQKSNWNWMKCERIYERSTLKHDLKSHGVIWLWVLFTHIPRHPWCICCTKEWGHDQTIKSFGKM